MNLYKRVYDSNAERLRAHVENMAPEIFRWMIVEGYGKVLSRPGLNIIDRETSIIAFLTMENRRKQLFSHIRGALNVGAGAEIVRLVVDDIGDAAGDGYKTALELLDSLDAKP
jgi:alkylhydroperoxidase/carboxymuconolactone decarboxylase family protein YurZ